MALPVHLALARFAPRMRKQEGELLVFDEAGMALLRKGQEIRRWAYPEVHRLRYHHWPTNLPRMFQFMSGGMFQRREAHFRLEAGEEVHEFWLETDIEFRSGDLRDLFGELYERGVALEEYSHSGNRMRMLGRGEVGSRSERKK